MYYISVINNRRNNICYEKNHKYTTDDHTSIVYDRYAAIGMFLI